MVQASTITDRKHNSIKGQVSDSEWQTRVDLAAGCRIAHKFGWNKNIRNGGIIKLWNKIRGTTF